MWSKCRDHYGYGLGQWKKALRCENSSHWLSRYLEWSLRPIVSTAIIVSGNGLPPVRHQAVTKNSCILGKRDDDDDDDDDGDDDDDVV